MYESQQAYAPEQDLVPSRVDLFDPQSAQTQRSNWIISEEAFVQNIVNPQLDWVISEEEFILTLLDTEDSRVAQTQ